MFDNMLLCDVTVTWRMCKFCACIHVYVLSSARLFLWHCRLSFSWCLQESRALTGMCFYRPIFSVVTVRNGVAPHNFPIRIVAHVFI